MKTIKSFSLFTESISIENKERLLPEIIEILNLQIANELESSQIYRGMSCWLDDNGWVEATGYFFKSSDEELNHMRKIYNYLFDKNCLAKVPAIKEVEQSFNSIREIVEKSLEHEILVTSMWEKIANLAKEKDDNTTYIFSQWFVNEQVEEEQKFRDILFKMDLDMPDWKVDELFGELNEVVK